MDAHDGTTFNYALLPAELLQVVGGRLCSRDLRHARLVCVGWATALAHSMPAVTVALPRQASERIFRQPLVLCSSGILNSAQSRDYSAIPRQAPAHTPVLGRRRSCRHSHDGSSTSSGSPACGAACKRACTGSGCSGARPLTAARSQTEPGVCPLPPQQQVDEEAGTSRSLAAAEAAAAVEAQQPVSRDKPSPFATEMGQAVLDCLLEDPLLAAGSKQVSCSAATAAAPAAAGASTAASSIPKLPRMGAIKAAISMPPTLAEQAAATQQQQAMQPDAQHMRKLSSLPASSARPVPRTRHVSKPAASQQQGPPAGPHHVVTTQGPAIQGWSSLPSAGLRTCSSLKQLHLKLSGAPPSPDDLLDLSKLMHLTHLSFKQVDEPDQQEQLLHTTLQEDSAELHCSSSSSSEPDHMCLNAPPVPAASTAVCSKEGHCAAGPSGVKRSYSTGPVRLQASVGGLCSDVDAATAAAACALEGCHIHGVSPAACMQQIDDTPAGWAAGQASGSSSYLACSSSEDGTPDACMLAASDWQQDGADGAGTAAGEGMQEEEDEEGCVLGSDGRMSAQSISCSVITPEHVAALAQLPHLSSLELAPKAGLWDAVSREGLLHLAKLTGLTRLSITWGDAAAAAAGPLSAEDAAAAAQGEQLPLQKCLAGLTSLQELCINGAAVVDVAVLQRLQQLRCLTAEGLQVIHSDAMTLIAEAEQQQQQQLEQQQQAEADQQEASTQGSQPVLSAAAAAPAGPQPAAPAQGSRWASLPHLQYVHAVHPTSDISLLLQSTVTPQLSHLGFVTRGPSDFARLLGQHGKLRTLHLAFAEEEPWHPIAVVRLPTALPSLRSLTIDGGFWLPNSLIVALGVMDVPLEHLSLTCKLAPPCLQRLQHLKQLKRLALHHVPPAAGSGEKNNAMLQLPAKLLPPQLQELEISNGWILH